MHGLIWYVSLKKESMVEAPIILFRTTLLDLSSSPLTLDLVFLIKISPEVDALLFIVSCVRALFTSLTLLSLYSCKCQEVSCSCSSCVLALARLRLLCEWDVNRKMGGDDSRARHNCGALRSVYLFSLQFFPTASPSLFHILSNSQGTHNSNRKTL